jgi:hypothetical protein
MRYLWLLYNEFLSTYFLVLFTFIPTFSLTLTLLGLHIFLSPNSLNFFGDCNSPDKKFTFVAQGHMKTKMLNARRICIRLILKLAIAYWRIYYIPRTFFYCRCSADFCSATLYAFCYSLTIFLTFLTLKGYLHQKVGEIMIWNVKIARLKAKIFQRGVLMM